ncbi:neoverrucotoxin subunit beta-like [Brachyhypopomus gauderio]|uniref:neoverrucotoxin subunit beta-like n=1 Tax=Brachyhypopomus gauderio TaxID=698409 RepID=UPI0040420DE4
MSSLVKEVVEVPCLGRPLQLGMLYDLRSDRLVPGLTLWDNNEIQRHKNVTPQQFTQMKISCSDGFEDKAAYMDISGSLKLSVMSGKVNVEGSAKYLNDNKKSTKQSSFTLTYHVTTQFEQLTMDHFANKKLKYTEVFDSDLATHVVTAVLYGANAFFVFNRYLDSNEDKTEIEGSIKLAFSNLSCFGISVEGDASGRLNESEKSATEKFSCKFYGDFTLPANPFSLESAVEMYKELPNMLGERGENAVPLKVWLYPLTKLDSKVTKCVRDIGNSIITTVSDAIESLNIVEIKCNDLIVDTAAQTFPAFHQKLQDLKTTCNHYKLDLLKKVGSLLPLIRGGEEEESVLVKLLNDHEESPFSSTELHQWIKIKEEESDVLKVFLEKLQCSAQDICKSTVFTSILNKYVVCFTFTSLDEPDHFLDYLSNYTEQKSSIKPESWLTPDVGQRMRKNLKLFTDLKSLSKSDTKFVVMSEHHKKHPGACIMVYGDKYDGAVCFTPPCKPTCSVADPVTDSSVTVKLSPACEDSVKRKLQYKMKQHEKWKCQHVEQKEQEVTLTDLNANAVYQIKCTAVDVLGKYPISSDVITIQTPKLHFSSAFSS